jgi:hypothetical protein
MASLEPNHCSCYGLLINYIFCYKAVMDCKSVYLTTHYGLYHNVILIFPRQTTFTFIAADTLLTTHNTVVTVCTTCFHTKNSAPCAQCVCVFRVIPLIRTYCSPNLHKPTCLPMDTVLCEVRNGFVYKKYLISKKYTERQTEHNLYKIMIQLSTFFDPIGP